MPTRSSTKRKPPIRVLLAEDLSQVRPCLRAVLRAAPGIKVVGEVTTPGAALRSLKRYRPDVVVLDVSTPATMKVIARARERFPSTSFIALSTEANARRIRQAVRAEATGYLIKDASTRLSTAVRAVARGEKYLSPVAQQSLARLPRRDSSPRESRLTPRQHEVLRLIAEGHSNKQIAAILNISIKTVETHRTRLMAQLNIHEVTGLVRYAIRVGLATSEG